MDSGAKTVSDWLIDLDFLGLWLPGMLFVILELVYIALCQGSLSVFTECMRIEYLIPFLVVSYVVGCALQAMRIMMKLRIPIFSKHSSSAVKKDNFFDDQEWKLHDKLKEAFMNNLDALDSDKDIVESKQSSEVSEAPIADVAPEEDVTPVESKLVVNLYEAYLQQTELGGFERSFRLLSLISLDYQTALALSLTAAIGILQEILININPGVQKFFGVDTAGQMTNYVCALAIVSIIIAVFIWLRARWFTRYRTRYICRQVFMHHWRVGHNGNDIIATTGQGQSKLGDN